MAVSAVGAVGAVVSPDVWVVALADDENGTSVEETLRTFDATADKDRREHRQEYQPTAGSAS